MPASRDPADQTRRVQLPDETGEVPVTFAHAEPRWFGVPPPFTLLGVAVLALVVAIALLVVGRWPFALILLGIAALLGAAFLELARRRPQSSLTRASAGAATWASSRFELVRARTSAIAGAERIRAARAVLEAERRAAVLRLGEAEQSGDDEAAAAARARLEELGRLEQALDGRLEEQRALADDRIRRVRMSIDQTMIVRPDEDTRRPAA